MIKHPRKNIRAIRREIDRIDFEIVELLAQRLHHVREVASLKVNEQSIVAIRRVNSMLRRRKEWARECGIDECVIEDMFHELHEYFVREEMLTWRSLQSITDEPDEHDHST